MSEISVLRLFVAIDLPDDVRAGLRRWQSELQPLLLPRAVRWTKPEQFHLTLKFLRNVPVADTDALRQAIGGVCQAARPMRLRAEGAGFFPNAHSPRVLWVDIKSADGLLMDFQRQLERAIERFAEKREDKTFTAHVTLARLEKWRSGETEKLKAAVMVGRTFGEWAATEVQLIKSSLMPSGVLHAILDTFKVKNE